MLLIFALGFLAVIGFILATVVSSFIPFIQSFNNMDDYYVSYYGAVSSLERGLLATKYKQPGFVGSGGWEGTQDYGASSDSQISNFGRISDGASVWSVDSETTRVGKGSTNYIYATTGSEALSKIDYQKVQVIYFGVDESNETLYYTGTSTLGEGGALSGGTYTFPKKLADFLEDDVDISNFDNKFRQIMDDLDSGNNSKREVGGVTFVVQNGVLYFWISDPSEYNEYPFLDYSLDFDNGVGDTSYDVVGEGKVGDYQIELEAQKKTSNIVTPNFKDFSFPTLSN